MGYEMKEIYEDYLFYKFMGNFGEEWHSVHKKTENLWVVMNDSNECVDIYQAVDAYTAESAYAEFNEDVKGRIKPGFLADFAVLSDDIFTIDPVKLLDVKADMTIVGGRVVFER